MPKLTKKIKQSEEHFHDDWAKHEDIDKLDPRAPFEGHTSPEYKEAVRMFGDVKGKKILNIGCGLGEEAVYLALKGAKVTAIDLSKEMTVIAKKLAKKHKVDKKIVFKQMDAEALTVPANSFDGILGCAILHHGNIQKMIKEAKRVLKPGGKGVFLEPLKYNPIINVYRKMASKVRTDDEHPIGEEDYALIKKYFPKMQHTEYQLTTLLIFVWFYLVEQVHPNKARYWKKIVTEGKKYEKPFLVLHNIDKILLSIEPLRKYCWVSVIQVTK